MLSVELPHPVQCYREHEGRHSLEEPYHMRRPEDAASVQTHAINPHELLQVQLGPVDFDLPKGVREVERPQRNTLVDRSRRYHSHVARQGAHHRHSLSKGLYRGERCVIPVAPVHAVVARGGRLLRPRSRPSTGQLVCIYGVVRRHPVLQLTDEAAYIAVRLHRALSDGDQVLGHQTCRHRPQVRPPLRDPPRLRVAVDRLQRWLKVISQPLVVTHDHSVPLAVRATLRSRRVHLPQHIPVLPLKPVSPLAEEAVAERVPHRLLFGVRLDGDAIHRVSSVPHALTRPRWLRLRSTPHPWLPLRHLRLLHVCNMPLNLLLHLSVDTRVVELIYPYRSSRSLIGVASQVRPAHDARDGHYMRARHETPR